MFKNNDPRMLLAKVRNGDFAHAGEEEAIDIVFKNLSAIVKLNNTNSKILDVGCGSGGTAAYVKKRTLSEVYGIDIDDNALKRGATNYSDICLSKCDIMDLPQHFNQEQFDLIYLFNVFYAIPQKRAGLKAMSNVAKPGAILAIFDYTTLHGNDAFELKDLSSKRMEPLSLEELKIDLEKAGWNLIQIIDLSNKYAEWYQAFLKNLVLNKNLLLEEFAEETFNTVWWLFSVILDHIKNKKIGGAVIYASLKNYIATLFEKENDYSKKI